MSDFFEIKCLGKEDQKKILEEIKRKIKRQALGTSEQYIGGLNYAKDVINERIGDKLT